MTHPLSLDVSEQEDAIVAPAYSPDAEATLFHGDCLDGMKGIPSGESKLIITSPPYNIGKSYETATSLQSYLDALNPVIDELVRVMAPNGSLCWQVGNFVDAGEVFPLDIYFHPVFKRHGLKLRNRIVWTFDHGLHASKRFSGRYETILWFTKGDDYTFNLDPVRVPSKYPGKRHFKGDKKGEPSCNPLGKNPSDIWRIVAQDWESEIWNVPNVKANHPEKTTHPCQYPIELVERCVLALTDENDLVLDPFAGVGSTVLAALMNGRRAMGCDREGDYIRIATERVTDLRSGTLRYRLLGKPVFQPTGKEKVARIPDEWLTTEGKTAVKSEKDILSFDLT